MTSILGRMFGKPREAAASAPADTAYQRAVAVSDDLLGRMRVAYASSDPARQVFADILAQRHNMPVMTTIYEAVQEATSPLKQKPEDLK